VQATGIPTAIGQFAADMTVTLVNDGPATFIVDSQG
jgi:D-Tyr-tRNAtyr deacylase